MNDHAAEHFEESLSRIFLRNKHVRDVFGDMHEAAREFAVRPLARKVKPKTTRLMRAAFLAGAAWHDALSPEDALLLRKQAFGATLGGTLPSPEAVDPGCTAVGCPRGYGHLGAHTDVTRPKIDRVLTCPYPGCDIPLAHNLLQHPSGARWAAEHDLWDGQLFVAPERPAMWDQNPSTYPS